MLERGLLSRLKELSSQPSLRPSTTHLLCSLLKVDSSLYRTLLLRKKYSFLNSILFELNENSIQLYNDTKSDSLVNIFLFFFLIYLFIY